MGLEVCSKGKQAAFFMYYFFYKFYLSKFPQISEQRFIPTPHVSQIQTGKTAQTSESSEL